MKPERTKSYKEMSLAAEDLGQKFIDRWIVPEAQSEETQSQELRLYTGIALKLLGNSFPKSDPNWKIPNYQDNLSIYNLYDLRLYGEHRRIFDRLWQKIHASLNSQAFYIQRGSVVAIRECDFLVTTPINQTDNHVKEAEEAIERFKKTGKVDFYFRNSWPYPKNLKIGSKFLYVDRRAIRGFAVVTDISEQNGNTGNTRMLVNTWRWIKPIPVDYAVLKPPQRYAQAINHRYLRGIRNIQVIGEWLDPMPH